MLQLVVQVHRTNHLLLVTSCVRTLYVHVRLRLRNDLYCVEWGVKLYSLTYTVTSISTGLYLQYYQ